MKSCLAMELENESKIDCLVEFYITKFIPDQKIYMTEIEDCFDFTWPNWEECIWDIEESPEEFLVVNEFYGFKVNFVSQSFDHYAGGLDFEYLEGLGSDVFDGWKEEIVKIRDLLVEQYKRKWGKKITTDVVRFITAWSYHSWKDSYYDEFDTEWDLLGLVDFKNIPILEGEKN